MLNRHRLASYIPSQRSQTSPMCVPKMRERISSKLSSSAAAGAAACAAAAAYCRQPAAAAAELLRAAWAATGARQRRELRVEAAASCCAALGASSRVSRCNPLRIPLRLPSERRSAMTGAVCGVRADGAGNRAGWACVSVTHSPLEMVGISVLGLCRPIVPWWVRMEKCTLAGATGDALSAPKQ